MARPRKKESQKAVRQSVSLDPEHISTPPGILHT